MSRLVAVKAAGFLAFEGVGFIVTYRFGGDWEGGILAACAFLWIAACNLAATP